MHQKLFSDLGSTSHPLNPSLLDPRLFSPKKIIDLHIYTKDTTGFGKSLTIFFLQIVFGCAYGKVRKSVAKVCGRPIQHTKKLNCGSIIQFYCRGNRNKRNFCVLTKFNEDHNHICTTFMFHQETHKIDSQVELKAVQDAVEMNVKPVQLSG